MTHPAPLRLSSPPIPAEPHDGATATYFKTLTRSAGRTIRCILRHLTGKIAISASLTLFILGFVKLELGWKRESERAGEREPA